MPVPATMADLSLSAASNSPAGGDPIGNTLDDYLRAHAAILRSTNALASASIASASTTDLGSADAESVQITGTTTITSFGTASPGIVREVRFAGALVITHSSSIQLPGAVNYTTSAGDVLTFRSLGAGQWIMTGHMILNLAKLIGPVPDAQLSSNVPLKNTANTFTQQQNITNKLDVSVTVGTGIQIANTSNGNGSSLLLNATNNADADCNITVSQAGAANKFARIGPSAGADLTFCVNNADKLKLTTGGQFQYFSDGGAQPREVGFRRGEQNNQPAGYTFQASDSGRVVAATSAGSFTIPNGVFATGDIVTFVNTVGGSCTLAQGSGFQIRKAGQPGVSGNATVSDWGVATLYFQASNVCLVSGPGVT
jgi:hypothetical protein